MLKHKISLLKLVGLEKNPEHLIGTILFAKENEKGKKNINENRYDYPHKLV